jgi:divalent metal cation (Fe/Co/Zn/Cd) transporter
MKPARDQNAVRYPATHVTQRRQPLVCSVCAGAVLVGLVLNAAAGWWADPLAGLVIVYYGLHEGRVALSGHA